MLTAVLKAVKMLLSCCPKKNSQDAAVLTALKAVQDAEKKSPPQRPSTKTYSHQHQRDRGYKRAKPTLNTRCLL
jgi:hypothetical protein